MHSLHSDGSYTIAEAVASCKERGLAFMAFANKAALAADESMLLIPGVEMTSYFGHANVLGMPDALQDFRVVTPEAASSVLGRRGSGAALSR
ncbi:hypothetical protein ACFPYJ_19650 [Paenibacillus solisilvae]|uniref:Uncharacterized protein n=1 Tax=Paenibacillus solisilvae TaxID=2486751 RepID=A0ABW0VZH7_9BACL